MDFPDSFPIITDWVAAERTGVLLRKIVKSAENNGRKYPPLIIRHGRPVFLGQKAAVLDQDCNPPRRLVPAPVQLGIGRCDAAVAEGDTLTGVFRAVISAMRAAVFPVTGTQVLFPFLRILMGEKKGIHTEPVI